MILVKFVLYVCFRIFVISFSKVFTFTGLCAKQSVYRDSMTCCQGLVYDFSYVVFLCVPI